MLRTLTTVAVMVSMLMSGCDKKAGTARNPAAGANANAAASADAKTPASEQSTSGASSPKDAPSPNSAPVATPKPAGPDRSQVLVIKGLYLGMTVEETRAALAKLSQGGVIEVRHRVEYDKFIYNPSTGKNDLRQARGDFDWMSQTQIDELQAKGKNPVKSNLPFVALLHPGLYAWGHVVVEFDNENEKSQAVQINEPMLSRLFNAGDMTLKEFAQEMVNAYPLIEKMESRDGGFEYKSPLGFEIRIGTGTMSRYLRWKSIPKAADRKFGD